MTYKVTDSQGASTIKTITVTVREKSADKPAEPQKPNKPADTKPEKPSQQSESPKTADMSNIGLFGSMFAGSSGLLTMLLGKRRKKKEVGYEILDTVAGAKSEVVQKTVLRSCLFWCWRGVERGRLCASPFRCRVEGV